MAGTVPPDYAGPYIYGGPNTLELARRAGYPEYMLKPSPLLGGEAVYWIRDDKRSAWLSSDGRHITDQQLADMPNPFSRELLLQVLGEITPALRGPGND